MSIPGRLYPTKIYFSKYGGDSWYPETDVVVSGKSGSYNYRTKIFIDTTEILDMKQSQYIQVQMTLEQLGSPAGCYAVLATENITSSGSVVSDSGDGPSATLLQYAIAESYSYIDAECKTRVSGTNQAKGTTIYFRFNTTELKSNTVYYIYFLKQTAGTSTSSGFTSAKGIIITLDYEPAAYTLELYDDTELVDTVDVANGEYYTFPKLTRPGYKFLGWREVRDDNTLYNGTYMLTDSGRYFAVWEQETGSYIYFNNNGTPIKCEVYINNNTTPIRCDVYFNSNGTPVKI